MSERVVTCTGEIQEWRSGVASVGVEGATVKLLLHFPIPSTSMPRMFHQQCYAPTHSHHQSGLGVHSTRLNYVGPGTQKLASVVGMNPSKPVLAKLRPEGSS